MVITVTKIEIIDITKVERINKEKSKFISTTKQ